MSATAISIWFIFLFSIFFGPMVIAIIIATIPLLIKFLKVIVYFGTRPVKGFGLADGYDVIFDINW